MKVLDTAGDSWSTYASWWNYMGDVFRTLAGEYAKLIVKQARHEVNIGLLRMGLLVECYHEKQGRWPESLEVIAPELGGALPVDPFSGEAYIYRIDEDGFRLYSVSADGEDDGGVHGAGGDLVWRPQAGPP